LGSHNTHYFKVYEKEEILKNLNPPRLGPIKSDVKSKNLGIICDGCKENEFEGNRYSCEECPDFDLCEKCYKLENATIHDSHRFKMFENGKEIATKEAKEILKKT